MAEEEEPWEALDVDDSELPFLRPCKRQNFSPLSHSSSSQPKPSSPPPSPSPAPSLIPGPAGAVQAAMHRRDRGDRSFSGARDEDPVPTQEYIKRVLENGDARDDDDFRANSWLSALEFVRTEGMVDRNCASPGTPLGSIKNGFHSDRVALVVAIIKSCTPNGLGGLMLTVKDPTGTVGASIHRKVFCEGEFGKIITVGAVLVLQKVAVFAPLRSAFYLNITLNNMVKVISKDSGPPMKHNYAPSTFRYAGESSESSKKSDIPQPMLSLERTEGIMNNLRKHSEFRGSVNSNRVLEDLAVPENSCSSNDSCRNSVASAEKESLFMKQVMMNGITKTVVTENTLYNDEVFVTNEQPSVCDMARANNSSCSIKVAIATENLFEVPIDEEPDITCGTKKQTQLTVSRTSVPDWTDEQLDELSAFDE
ncbi:nuclear localized protein [Parasponia andersonii]|uniref:Nuclear localized protein n=1 Tax=Parasponia andersonii TaxID=3476 RepID=A0A2P5B7I3_PARAD|nr:nuclear localized protein [Parasponia andersonii]